MRIIYFVIASLVVVLATVFVLGIYLLFGCNYYGTEFSPDDFTVRDFSYSYEPYTDWVICRRSYSTNSFGGYTSYSMPSLVREKYIKPVFNKDKNWHLVEDNGSYPGDSSSDCDARFLVDFLSLLDQNGENIWTVWNSEYPKLAKVLWPLIAEMARDEMYLVVGDVLTFVIDSEYSDPKKFEADLRQEVAKAYLKLGKFDLENNDLESAELRLTKSTNFHSSDEAKSLLDGIPLSPIAEMPPSK